MLNPHIQSKPTTSCPNELKHHSKIINFNFIIPIYPTFQSVASRLKPLKIEQSFESIGGSSIENLLEERNSCQR
jgi:hypothetical protein